MSKNMMITDRLGRVLEVKNLTLADQFDLLEAAQNQARYEHWFSLASIVFSCCSIDGTPLPRPRKPEDFKKNATLLKDEGVEVILDYFAKNNEPSLDETMVESEKNS